MSLSSAEFAHSMLSVDIKNAASNLRRSACVIKC